MRRVKIDQTMRKQFGSDKKVWNDGIDRKNTIWLKKAVERYGWPTFSSVGKKAPHGAWLLVQHADHDVGFQKKVFELLERIYKDGMSEVCFFDIAYLTDRILVHQNKLQIFGT